MSDFRDYEGDLRLWPRWKRLWKGCSEYDLIRSYEKLAGEYAQPHRFFHTFDRVYECLELFDKTKSMAEDPRVVEAALFFLYADYRAGEQKNIERSAIYGRDLMIDHMKDLSFATASFRESVQECIFAIQPERIRTYFDTNRRLVADISLAWLGKGEVNFESSCQRIRKEWSFFGEERYLEHMLATLKLYDARSEVKSFDGSRVVNEIYFNECFRVKFGERARDNVRHAIARISEKLEKFKKE